MITPADILSGDTASVLSRTEDLWDDVRGGILFFTGGTGFFGRWMLETFVRANHELDLRAGAVVLTRDPDSFRRRAPMLAGHETVRVVTGDLVAGPLPDIDCTHIVHLAALTNTDLTFPPPSAYIHASVTAVERVLALARRCECRRLLFTSSGAVYGEQPEDVARLSEAYGGAPRPEDVAAAYAHGKRAAESLCAAAHEEWGLNATIARCFAFTGPYMNVESGFAIGNFIRDAVASGLVTLTGDGSPQRSYLYASDLAAWLWTILFRGIPARPYNVGSDEAVSILDLAELVARVVGHGATVAPPAPPEIGSSRLRYVPDVSRAVAELGVERTVELEEAVVRTAAWYAAEAASGTAS